MTTKNYDWEGGAELLEHTKKKHDILREYFRQYLITRCQLPQQERFRLAVVDGFSGAGLYKNGEFGSPLIFVDTLVKTTNQLNLYRLEQSMKPIEIQCLLILNDEEKYVIEQLRKNISPHLLFAKDNAPKLLIEDEYYAEPFNNVYDKIKSRLVNARCSNVLFNLDQCGYSHVTSENVRDIIQSWNSAEVLLTFMIEAMLKYISPTEGVSNVPLDPIAKAKIDSLLNNKSMGKNEWLGEVEQIVFEVLKGCAPFVSPFSINNPSGYRYWLMHFASSHRARQVYNNILHAEPASQAHFGGAGLNMLSYNPATEGSLYLFDGDSRETAKGALYNDIPRLIADAGDALEVEEFYRAAYSETPAHSDDIHEMIISNPDIEVITESGGERRKPNTIKIGDTLRLKHQRSMYFMFSDLPTK